MKKILSWILSAVIMLAVVFVQQQFGWSGVMITAGVLILLAVVGWLLLPIARGLFRRTPAGAVLGIAGAMVGGGRPAQAYKGSPWRHLLLVLVLVGVAGGGFYLFGPKLGLPELFASAREGWRQGPAVEEPEQALTVALKASTPISVKKSATPIPQALIGTKGLQDFQDRLLKGLVVLDDASKKPRVPLEPAALSLKKDQKVNIKDPATGEVMGTEVLSQYVEKNLKDLAGDPVSLSVQAWWSMMVEEKFGEAVKIAEKLDTFLPGLTVKTKDVTEAYQGAAAKLAKAKATEPAAKSATPAKGAAPAPKVTEEPAVTIEESSPAPAPAKQPTLKKPAATSGVDKVAVYGNALGQFLIVGISPTAAESLAKLAVEGKLDVGRIVQLYPQLANEAAAKGYDAETASRQMLYQVEAGLRPEDSVRGLSSRTTPIPQAAVPVATLSGPTPTYIIRSNTSTPRPTTPVSWKPTAGYAAHPQPTWQPTPTPIIRGNTREPVSRPTVPPTTTWDYNTPYVTKPTSSWAPVATTIPSSEGMPAVCNEWNAPYMLCYQWWTPTPAH